MSSKYNLATFSILAPELEQAIHQIPMSTLAYIGDAVYELYIRQYLMTAWMRPSKTLHKEAIRFVRASHQAQVARSIQDQLTEEESAILYRGRNHAPGAMPKHANPVDYRYATGLETLIGYLYLKDRAERIQSIIQQALELGQSNG